ncbi:hypothetical protein C5E45_32925 [Nocardia nova]|uniref:Uncharacterized protein n=1 Tax=Nocardia nova TaxID=37330 RepID=A0A2S6ACT5_9NOCA|nr:DUF6221 family protein [Nocardia nova]PPJ31896.1 hypothetical protein C5E45_32925 [Nocardia nova]
MTIVEFIEARIVEREARAEEALELEKVWRAEGYETEYDWVRFTRRGAGGTASSMYLAGAPSPAEVKRQCERLRSIVEEHDIDDDPCDAHGPGYESITCNTVLMVASVWSGHPDYQREWDIGGESRA